MATLAILVMGSGCAYAWHRATTAAPRPQLGTFYALLYLAGMCAPAIPALALGGAGTRGMVVPAVLLLLGLMGSAACFRPVEEDVAERSPESR